MKPKHETCPACGEPGIDTSRIAVNFWRCSCCRMAIVKRNGKLQTWLNPHQQPRSKRKARR